MPKSPEERQQEMAENIGALILTWSETEWLLMLLLSAILNCDLNRGRIVWASSTSFRAKRDLLSRLGETFLGDALLPEFRNIMTRVKHLAEKRNLVAHDRGYYLHRATFRFMNDQDPTQPNTFGRYRDVQVANVKQWAEEIKALGREIVELTERLMTDAASLHEQPRVLVKAPAEDFQ